GARGAVGAARALPAGAGTLAPAAREPAARLGALSGGMEDGLSLRPAHAAAAAVRAVLVRGGAAGGVRRAGAVAAGAALGAAGGVGGAAAGGPLRRGAGADPGADAQRPHRLPPGGLLA